MAVTFMDNFDCSKKPLVWPVLHTEINSNVEQINIGNSEMNISELLFEIECDYQHISKRLELLIGYPEFEMEMSKLLIPDRPGRQGFPKQVLSNLLKLSKLHTEKYGHLSNKPECVWSKNRA